jgi:hypothetical protein
MKIAATLLAGALFSIQSTPMREVAITIDDLPGSDAPRATSSRWRPRRHDCSRRSPRIKFRRSGS